MALMFYEYAFAALDKSTLRKNPRSKSALGLSSSSSRPQALASNAAITIVPKKVKDLTVTREHPGRHSLCFLWVVWESIRSVAIAMLTRRCWTDQFQYLTCFTGRLCDQKDGSVVQVLWPYAVDTCQCPASAPTALHLYALACSPTPQVDVRVYR